MKMAHSPPGHHSVIGRPSAGGLHFPEYVVYRGEQVRLSKSNSTHLSNANVVCVMSLGISRVLGHLSNCETRRHEWQRRYNEMMECQHKFGDIEYCGSKNSEWNIGKGNTNE